jgi:uncharacterized protein (DUF1778 family)
MSTQGRAMQIVSVRFGAQQIELIQQEASVEGVSASQFIRDSAYARAVLYAAKRNAVVVEMWDRMIAVVEESGYENLAGELRGLLDDVRANEESPNSQSHGV